MQKLCRARQCHDAFFLRLSWSEVRQNTYESTNYGRFRNFCSFPAHFHVQQKMRTSGDKVSGLFVQLSTSELVSRHDGSMDLTPSVLVVEDGFRVMRMLSDWNWWLFYYQADLGQALLDLVFLSPCKCSDLPYSNPFPTGACWRFRPLFSSLSTSPSPWRPVTD